MAQSQRLFPLVALLLLLTEFTRTGESCHPTSTELHICLNIYLERDFSHIETIIHGPEKSGYRNTRVLVEGPEIQDICRRIGELQTCYSNLSSQCDTYWQYGRYLTLMNAVQESYFYLCGNSTNNMRDLLINSECVRRAEPNLVECSKSGIQWFSTWKKIMRMQSGPEDLCPLISDYKYCLSSKLLPRFPCRKEDTEIYISLLDNWIDSWCVDQITYEAIPGQYISGTTAIYPSVSSKLTFSCVIMYILLLTTIIKHSE